MLQSILLRTIYKNLPTVSSAKCSTNSSLPLKKEINRVALVGTVIDNSQLENDRGRKFMLVKTKGEYNQRDQIHHLYTSVSLDFKEGQRVYVGAKLSSKKVITPENKTVSQPIIQAYQIFPLRSKNKSISDANKTTSNDLNSVELLTTVCADVINKDNHSIIHVVTHYMNQSTQEIRTNFHAIFVHDPDLRNFLVCGTVEKKDRIFVKGYLSGNTHTDANGKRFQSGFIVAEHIDKITRFDRKQSFQEESTESEGMFKM